MLKKKYIDIIGCPIALLLFIFVCSGSGLIKGSGLNQLSSGLSDNYLFPKTIHECTCQQELNSFQYKNSTRDLSDLFEKTDATSARQIDPDKIQLKALFTFNDYCISNKLHQADTNSSFKPQLTQSISLFIFNRNILI